MASKIGLWFPQVKPFNSLSKTKLFLMILIIFVKGEIEKDRTESKEKISCPNRLPTLEETLRPI